MRRFTVLRVIWLGCVLLALAALLAWLLPRLRPARGKVYHFYVEDTVSLPEGTEVKFRGLVVGQVIHVDLDEEKSRGAHLPWFRVEFQANEQGGRVLNLWSFRQVGLDKEVPVVGATVVSLVDPSMPGGRTPTEDALTVRKSGADGLPGPLQEIADNINELTINLNSTVQSLRGSLGMPPDSLGDDRHANLALCLQRDVYPLTDPAAGSSRPTRLAVMLENIAVMAARFQSAGENISTLTSEEGSINRAWNHVDSLASNLQDENKPFLRVFTDLKTTSGELRNNLLKVNTLLTQISPTIEQGARDAEQMTDTLKREPWRVVWRSTKTYDETLAPAPPSPSSQPTPRKRAVPRAAHTSPPAPDAH